MQLNVSFSKSRRDEQSSLQFYTEPPGGYISLQEFEDLAISRLKALKAIETVGIRFTKGSKEYNESLKNELKKLHSTTGLRLFRFNASDPSAFESDCRRDCVSHFILRMAYCKTEELRRWFVAQEVDLLRFRFQEERSETLRQFLEKNSFNFTELSKEGKLTLLDKLKAARGSMTEAEVEKSVYYVIHFTRALELVRNTKVYLSRGLAYVPQPDLVVVLLGIFRTNLSRSLTVASRAIDSLSEESRLMPLLNNLTHQYLGQDYGSGKTAIDSISAASVDKLSRTSFPLCMQELHQSLRQHHHLKHWGRMQYGLFLKAAGLSLDEAMIFWRSEFTKVMDSDKFDKQYSYNIRHNYGKEGKRADYTPYSCMKIITSNPPGTGDYHGCPFRHTDEKLLRQKLQLLSISSSGADEIMELARKGHYQIACGRYFESKNKTDIGFVTHHPNQYFEESRRLLKGNTSEGGVTRNAEESKTVIAKRSTSSQKSSQSFHDQIYRDDMDDDDLDQTIQSIDISMECDQ